MSHQCPECKRVLYNRRLKRCGFCNAIIPQDLQFTPAESAVLDRKMAELEESRRQRQLAQEADEAEARARAGDASAGIFPFNL
jgi:hypothetical protein